MPTTAPRTIHFDLAHLDCADPLTFHQSLKTYPVRAHDRASRTAARAELAFLALVPDDHLTHYVDVSDLPGDRVVLTYVTRRRTVDGRAIDAPVHMGVYVPPEGRAHAAARIRRGRSARARLHPALARFGATPERFAQVVGDDDDPEFPTHIESYQDALDAAIALLFHHPNLINLSDANGGELPAYIITQHITRAIEATNDLPIAILEQGDAYLVTTSYQGPDGTPASSTVPCADVQAAMTGSLQTALRTSQADATLAGQLWQPAYGSTTGAYNGGTTSGVTGQATLSATLGAILGATLGATPALAGTPGGDQWVKRDISSGNGLSIDDDSITVTPAPATDTWSATGVWSQNDVAPRAPLTADLVTALKAGSLSLMISATGASPFVLSGALTVAAAPDPNTGLTTVSTTLSPVGTLPAGVTPTSTVVMTLNSGETGLTYAISAAGLGTSTATCGIYSGTGSSATLVCALAFSDMSGLGTMSIQCTNSWLRHLAAYVQYLDVAGNVLTPSTWSERMPEFLIGAFETDGTKKFLGVVPPVTTVFGVPVPATPTTLTFPIWEEVHTVRLLWGGLGRGAYDSAVCPIGIVTTALCELVLPPFLLAAGTAITNSSFVAGLMADTEVLGAVCVAGAFLVAGPAAAYIALSQDPGEAATGLTERFAPMLLSPLTSLGKWVAKKFAEGAVERATPFIDIALLAVNCVVTAAELAQTIVAVLDAPFVYETDLIAAVDLVITLYPDPAFNKFPDYHDHFTVTVVYDVGTTQPTYTQQLPATTLSDPIVVTFSGVPAGGMARAYAFFYAADDWQSGQGVGDWTPMVGVDGTCNLTVTVITNEVPLTVNSVYYHVEKLALVGGALNWQAAVDTPPTATIATPSPYQDKAVVEYCGVTMTQQAEMIGVCYQAKGLDMPPNVATNPPSNDALYMLENISMLEHPGRGTSTPAVAFTTTPGTAYNMAAAEGTTGTSFFIDSSPGAFDPQENPAGGCHVRGIVLTHDTPPVFATGSDSSYGRFPIALDRYVFHPQGRVIGVSLTKHKIFLLTLASTPGTDANAPMATMASGEGFRDGLIYGPSGVAVALDGRVLVLESLNNRIQAFDLHGTPVQYFGETSAKTATMALHSPVTSTYLDIAVESKGYIYVLYYTAEGADPSDYHIDIYNPDGSFLVSTPNVAAANLTVDILRNVFTVNYETILDSAERPQPSVSHWMPPAPPGPNGATLAAVAARAAARRMVLGGGAG